MTKEKDHLSELLKHNLSSSASFNFTNEVMDKIEAELEARATPKPLIAKSTWIMITIFIITLSLFSVINSEQFSLQDVFVSTEEVIPSFIQNIKSWWFYIPLGFIFIWEIIFRRALNII